MGIVYDAPSNVITVTGTYTNNLWSSIYAADVGGGWGVVTQQGSIQYYSTAMVQIGDGSTATACSDINQQITFAASLTNYCIWVKNNATLQFGALDDATSKSTSRGCHLRWLNTGTNDILIGDDAGATIKLYSCLLASDGGYNKLYGVSGNGIIYNTVLAHNMYVLGTWSYLFNVTIQNVYYALYNTQATFEDVTITYTNAGQGAIVVDGANSVTLDGPRFRFNTYLVRPWAITADSYLVDVDTDVWAFNWGGVCTHKIYRQYTVNLHVVDAAGANVSGATVTLTNAASGTVFSVSTAADGTIAEQTVSRGYYAQATGNTLQDAGPFTLTITKAGYMPYVHTGIVLDEPVDWRLYLRTQLSGDAVAGDVWTGKTFYSTDADTQLTGTAAPSSGGAHRPPPPPPPRVDDRTFDAVKTYLQLRRDQVEAIITASQDS